MSLVSDRGHIELDRQVDSIVVGQRHRRDPGDLTSLVDSLKRVGLLQPITISPDGHLICGFRRLEAAKALQWRTVRVWVRSGLSDELTRLLAERDENTTHKPLSPLEAARLYEELRTLIDEDADRRKKATQFGAKSDKTAGQPGHAESAGPQSGGQGEARRRAAEMVTGKAAYARLEQILAMERIAADPGLSPALRDLAETELDAIRGGAPVDPGYQRVTAAQRVAASATPADDNDVGDLAEKALKKAKADKARRIKENRAKREAAAANSKRSTRSFTLKWIELAGWSQKYDPEQIAREIKTEDWALFLRVLEETEAFADAVDLARSTPRTPDSRPATQSRAESSC
ncbi:ParB N-terminal domain-containing protein [Nostocoides sp. F2B08]|uniref:ParB N-terminal domain-containing protein n=1 Tax=Nostocoides sp. F2B08 TaxID=2653936 RepID=UPI00186B0DC2|nr:ParB N-terminal domain-containing protein [Tetrasphaera sp. F2B08]